MKKSITHVASIILIVFSLLICIIHYFFTKNQHKKQELVETLLADKIYNELFAELQNPVTVSKTMANDEFLYNFLEQESDDLKADEAAIKPYLSRLKDGLGYAQVTFISNKTRRYYRDDEMHKIVDPYKNPHDIWYANFSDSNANFFIGVYRHATAPEKSTMYLNVALRDFQGKLLGVASPSLYVTNVINRIREYERTFNVKICFTKTEGLVELTSNYNDIETASLAYLLPSTPSAEFRHINLSLMNFAVTKYIEDFGWYFILTGTHPQTEFPSHLFYILIIVLLAASLCTLHYARKQFQAKKPVFYASAAQKDPLTGLPNRNFFKDMFGERGVFNTTRYRYLAVFDIDFFKEANDTMNGDEIIVSVVSNMLSLLNERGMVLRWGGDEFLVLFELPLESSYAVCRQFVKDVERDGLVTVSVGLTEIRLSDTIKKNYYRAAQYCYLVKEMGGNGVKKD
ncbi:GGDEF domain-containing protein [Treponema zioleckii]|uniref:GGDEF domain-containing protein n=1 Tax=Treponema zioleckii TaxID=331680 RepID=UPI00168BAE72|nr:GGDEF domain-containing protein [Treponema zioleckii]